MPRLRVGAGMSIRLAIGRVKGLANVSSIEECGVSVIRTSEYGKGV